MTWFATLFTTCVCIHTKHFIMKHNLWLISTKEACCMWGQTFCCSVIGGKLQLKYVLAAKRWHKQAIKNITRWMMIGMAESQKAGRQGPSPLPPPSYPPPPSQNWHLTWHENSTSITVQAAWKCWYHIGCRRSSPLPLNGSIIAHNSQSLVNEVHWTLWTVWKITRIPNNKNTNTRSIELLIDIT